MSRSRVSTLKFLYRLNRGKEIPCRIGPLTVYGHGESLTGLMYGTAQGGHRGTILVISGLSVHSIGDPRIDVLCRAMAAAGFLVLLPVYNDIRDFRITADTVDAIVSSITAITGNTLLCPSGTLSIVAPSFSGGLALIAASRRETASKVRAVCTIGTYGSIATVLPSVLEQQDNDEYGRMIIMKNFIRYSTGRNEALERALELAYLDGGYRRQTRELDAYLEKMSEKDREIFTGIRYDWQERKRHWEKIVSHADVSRTLASMDVLPALNTLKAAVTLIHGREDRVIPCQESQLLHDALCKKGIPSRLSITSLITHGDTDMKTSLFMELYDLAGAFSFFFHHAQTGRVSVKSLTSAALCGSLFR